jgi:endonuclease YncB( thermonuclease family)
MNKLISGVVAFLGFTSIAVADPPPFYWAFNEIADVHDGDTFTIPLTPYFVKNAKAVRVKVRLHGVDAPERGQVCNNLLKGGVFDCAKNATEDLDWLLNDNRGTLNCLKISESYDRWVMKCSKEGIDVSSHMVETGNVLVDTRFTSGLDEKMLLALEEEARANGIGVHMDSEMEKPWDWRKTR